MTQLTTARLRLAPFTDSHVEGLNAMNADPEVMRYISGRPETMEETAAMVQRVKQRWAEFGYAWWSFMDRGTGEIVGAGCVQNLRREVSLHPDPACPLEIGWRLRRDHWGQGLASEAAQVIASFAFDALHADELYAVCQPENTASAKVMARLGMQCRGLQHWYGEPLMTYDMSLAQWRARVAPGN